MTLSKSQPNYDPVFKSWAAAKVYENVSVNAIVDRIKPGMYADLQAAGRITDAEYVVIFDLPFKYTVKDKVKIMGEEFFLDSIQEFDYQILCAASKVTPKGKQF